MKTDGCPPGQIKQKGKCIYKDPLSKKFDERLGDRLAHLHLRDIEREIVLPAIEQIIDDYDDYIGMVERDPHTSPYDPDLLKHKKQVEQWINIKATIERMRRE